MRFLQSYSFNEKFAAGLLVLFGPIYLATAISFGPDSDLLGGSFGAIILWKLSWAIIAFVVFCAAIATVFFKPAYQSSHFRMHLGRFLPVMAMGAAMLLSAAALDAFSRHQMNAFAKLHESKLAGPPPRAIVYREGIPDGGIAIIRSPGQNPEGFDHPAMLELTGEPIKSCASLSDRDWVCHFD